MFFEHFLDQWSSLLHIKQEPFLYHSASSLLSLLNMILTLLTCDWSDLLIISYLNYLVESSSELLSFQSYLKSSTAVSMLDTHARKTSFSSD